MAAEHHANAHDQQGELHELRRLPALPSVTLRNIELEQHLEALVSSQSIVSVAAPEGSGKSTAIASWLRNSAEGRYPTWIESTLDPDDRADVVAQVREIALKLCGENPPKLEWGTAPHRRAAARTLSEHMTRPAIFVVHRPRPGYPVEFDSGRRNRENQGRQADRELLELVTECDHLSLVIIENAPRPVSTATPTIGLSDLSLSSLDLHREAQRLGAPLPELVATAIGQQFGGSPVIAAAYLDAVLQNPTASALTALQNAHTEVLLDCALSALGPIAAPALALMAVLESATAEMLATTTNSAISSAKARTTPPVTTDILTGRSTILAGAGAGAGAGAAAVTPTTAAAFADALEMLASRNLILVTRVESAPPTFALHSGVREHVRARTITHYLDNRLCFHTAASRSFRATGDMFQAVRHLMLVDQVDAALTLFCAVWDSITTPELTRLCTLFGRDAVLGNLEAVAIFWIVGSGETEKGAAHVPQFSKRLLRARLADVGELDLRGRLTVRAAMARVLLEENRLEDAMTTVADAASDLQRARSASRRSLGGAYTEHVLSAAKCSLVGGDLSSAFRLFEDAATAARTTRDDSGFARASLGLALCSIFNADFDVAQRYIDRCNTKLDNAEIEFAAAWAQLLLWSAIGADAKLKESATLLGARAAIDIRWRVLSQFVDATLLAVAGRFADATNALRNLVGLTLGSWQQPLFQQTVRAMLALVSLLSNFPGTGFAALSAPDPSENHAVCFNAFRSFLESGRGDPVAALRATDSCIAGIATHAKLMLPYVYLSRSIAYELMLLPQAAADAFAVSTALAAGNSQRLLFAEIVARFRIDEKVAPTEAGRADNARSVALTPKEREVLTHLFRDETLAVIATSLFVSDNTLKSHTRSIYRKLGVSSRRDAVDRGALLGLV